nr:MAG TPA: hypothetical protein [Caudoviricetes sp.]
MHPIRIRISFSCDSCLQGCYPLRYLTGLR